YDDKTLYRYGTVASIWSSEEIDELLDKKGVTGLPIRLSHLFLIAAIESRAQRAMLVTAVHDKGLSVRELKAWITTASSREPPKGAATPRRAPREALHDLRSASAAWLKRIDQWEADVLPALEQG